MIAKVKWEELKKRYDEYLFYYGGEKPLFKAPEYALIDIEDAVLVPKAPDLLCEHGVKKTDWLKKCSACVDKFIKDQQLDSADWKNWKVPKEPTKDIFDAPPFEPISEEKIKKVLYGEQLKMERLYDYTGEPYHTIKSGGQLISWLNQEFDNIYALIKEIRK